MVSVVLMPVPAKVASRHLARKHQSISSGWRGREVWSGCATDATKVVSTPFERCATTRLQRDGETTHGIPPGGIQRRSAPGSAGLLACPGRAALPASASSAPVRRYAGAAAPAYHHHPVARLAAAPGAHGPGRTGAGRERGRPFPAGSGGSCPLSGGAAAVAGCGAGGTPAHPFGGEAIPGARPDSPERFDAVRGRHRVGISPAQLGAR